MKPLSRIFVSAMAALATFYLMWLVPVVRVLVLVRLLCAAVAARYTWQHTAWASPGLVICILLGGVATGATGLLAGLYWSAHFYPGANQGPLLGIIFTGPLSFLAGAAAGGAIYWGYAVNQRKSTRPDGRTTG